MTKRESEILQLIKNNPLLSQNAMALKLGITRSSVAVHLSNLMKKGLIKGKGYIIDENPYVCVIGGANVDLVGFPTHKLIFRDANLGNLKISMGGVGRNIAENLVRLGVNTKLICALGDDIYGKLVVENCEAIGIDIQESLFLKNRQSSVHLAIMDDQNDLALGLSAMDVYDEMTSHFIRKKKEQIKNAKLVVLDTNISAEVLIWVTENIPTQKYFLDAVSIVKSIKAKEILKHLYMIKVNIAETQSLTNVNIKSLNDLKIAADFFHQKGIKEVFITQGEEGVFYSNSIVSGTFRPKKEQVVNTNGAGDAFVAGVVYGHIKGVDIENSAKIGMACASMAICHEDTVNPEINETTIKKMTQRNG